MDNYNFSSGHKHPGQFFGHKDIKLSFLGKEYFFDESSGKTTCRLTCKLNISEIEKKCVMFSDQVKKIVLEGLMSTYHLYSTEPRVYYKKVDGKHMQVITEEPHHEYKYFDTFTVEATVKTDANDEYDETTGKILAEAKAKYKAYRKAALVENKLGHLFTQLAESFYNYSNDMHRYAKDETERYKRYGRVMQNIKTTFSYEKE